MTEMNLDAAIDEAQTENGRPVNLLLPFLKGRLELAKKFSKTFQDEVKKNLKDYDAESSSVPNNGDIAQILAKRYEFVIPYIFATHESMLSSLFEKAPDLIISGRGAQDTEKAAKVVATYEYLWDKLDLDTFMNESAWWFLLVGFASASANFKSEYHEVPAQNEDGTPMLEEDGVTPVMTVVYDYNDPILETDNPEKIYFSPESRYSIDAKKVPYYFREANMDVDIVEEIYGIEVKATDVLEVEGMDADEAKKKFGDEAGRVKIHQYYGNIPKRVAKEFWTEQLTSDYGEWQMGKNYYVVFCSTEVLALEEREDDEQSCRVVKWLGRPTSFYGFGIGKTLSMFQRELSIRRGQEIRYADVCAYAKMAVEMNSQIDVAALQDPRANVVLTYTDKPPTYLIPPDLSQTLIQTEAKAREDAQFVSGMLDLSKGAQDSKTVQTATGQTIFADSSEKRIKKARKELGKYLRSVVIMLLKLCQKYWEENKVMTITDEDGNEEEVEVEKDDFKDIDFDNDIDIDLESITVNKEVMREQAIALYDKTKDDPIVERRKVFMDLMKDGFGKKNAEDYVKPSGIEPGQTLTDDATGQKYSVGEDGEIMPVEASQELAQPTTSGQEMASTQAGALDVQP